jgi:enoyl-CoA hydratase
MAQATPGIRLERNGRLGVAVLERQEALNALTRDMIQALSLQLLAWRDDPEVAAVLIEAAPGRAFCAGGDVRHIYELGKSGRVDEAAEFYREEYRLNWRIFRYPKPYIAFLDGITMGGGAGVSIHGSHRLADASLMFAMPETGIGFIPDVGSSYFLSRLPDRLGFYLGLTANSIGIGDAMAAGLVTQAVARSDFDAVIASLADRKNVEKAIAPFARKPEPGLLAPHRRRIATFSGSSVEAVLERLDRDGSDFAIQTAQIMRTRSPTSLKLVFRQLHEAEKLSLNQCLAMEFRLALRVLQHHDFREGVRAALVDKDRRPKWEPSSLAGVADLGHFFAGLGDDELFRFSENF